jgi:Tfp pilus assembly protein PilO
MNDKKFTNFLSEYYRNPVASVSLELILTIVLVLSLTFFAIKPTLTTMGKLSKEITEKEEVVEKLEQKIIALNTAQNEYYAWEDKLSLLDSAFPSADNSLTDVKTIERLAYENDVVLTSLSLPSFPEFKDKAKLEVYNQPLSLTVEGDYVSIKNFVGSLIDNRRVLVINSITFSIRKQKQTAESLSATMTINSPYYY